MTKLRNWPIALMLFSMLFALSSCEEDTDPPVDMDMNIAETAVADSDLSSLVAALTRADLVSTLEGNGPFTVLAPTNAAFAAFLSDNGFASVDDIPVATLQSVLLNHVVSGSVKSTDLSTGYVPSLSTSAADASNTLSLYVDTSSGVSFNGGADVSAADIEATNGIIHKVNSVIGSPSIVNHALNNPEFSTLVAALTRADLTIDFVSVLSGNGPFTVFAPTNAAFADLLMELGASSLDDIDTPTLEAVLQYHVINGANVKSTDLSNGQSVVTLQGGTITINLDGGPSITDAQNRMANIILTDVQGTNGIIHAINKVILP